MAIFFMFFSTFLMRQTDLMMGQTDIDETDLLQGNCLLEQTTRDFIMQSTVEAVVLLIVALDLVEDSPTVTHFISKA